MTATRHTAQGSGYLIQPDPHDERLSDGLSGIDHTGRPVSVRAVTERPLTLFLNGQEIVTMMTIGDYPDLLAVGFLRNQRMLNQDDTITAIDHDEELGVVVVRTGRETDYEQKLQKKIRTSGCAQGTVFGDVMDEFEAARLKPSAVLKTSWLYALNKTINLTPSLYLEAGAIHGSVLCKGGRPLVFMEDVGRHNAVDKLAGWMFLNKTAPEELILYTTGRLTSEMVIKTVLMGIPILISRSGFTAWGVSLARQAGLTLIGRARGKRFVALSGERRIEFDADAEAQADEPAGVRRKGAAPE